MANEVPVVEFMVEYKENCPGGAEVGNPNVALGFNMETGISCALGLHTFDALPSAQANRQPGTDAASGADSEPAVTIEGLDKTLQAAVPDPAKGPTPEQAASFECL